MCTLLALPMLACSDDGGTDSDTAQTEETTGDGDGDDPAGDGDADDLTGDGDGSDPTGDGDGDGDGSDSDSDGDGDGDDSAGDGDGDDAGAEGFGDCATQLEADACTADEVCYMDAEPLSHAICGEPCTSVDDCPPAPATGDALVTCVDVTVDEVAECILACDAGQTCPDGMVCIADILCMWPA